MKKVKLVLCAAALVGMAGQSVGAADFCINTTLPGGAHRNFRASMMSVVGNTASITVVDLASVNVIGVGALNVNNNFLAPLTLAFTVMAGGTTENFDCSLFAGSLSGLGDLLTVRNVGITRVQVSPCAITPPPCP